MINVATAAPVTDPNTDDKWSASLASLLEDFQAVTWERLVEASMCDETCASAIRYLESGFPENKNELPEKLRPLWHYREVLYTHDNTLLYENRMYIPQSLRRELLEYTRPTKGSPQ